MRALYLAIYYLVAAVMVIYANCAVQHKTHLGKKCAFTEYSGALLLLCYTGNIIFYQNYFLVSLCNTGVFVFIDFVLIAVVDTLVTLCSYEKNKTVKIILDACRIYAFFDCIIMLINPFKEIALTYMPSFWAGRIIYTYKPSFLYMCHLVFSYSLIFIDIAIVTIKCLSIPREYWYRYLSILISILVVVLLNLLFLIPQVHLTVDISILLYGFVAAIIYHFAFKFDTKKFLYSTKKLLLQYMTDPVIVFDYEESLVDNNMSALELFPVLQKHYSEKPIALDEFLTKEINPLLTTQVGRFKGIHIIRNNKDYYYEYERILMHNNKRQRLGSLLIFHDITAERNASERYAFLAYHDTVTGLNNRTAFNEQCHKWDIEISKTESEQIHFSAVVLNVNGLSVINDVYGWKRGDAVMQTVAELLVCKVPEGTYIALLGNGDFVLIFKDCASEEIQKILEEITATISLKKEGMFEVSTEYGISSTLSPVRIESLVREARSAMKNRKLLNRNSTKSSLIDSLEQTLTESDYETEAHVRRTQKTAFLLGQRLNLDEAELGKLAILAVLHDIGKVAIPKDILLKPADLSSDEWKIMKTHTNIGYRIAKASPELEEIADCILHHHERWDGTGYPDKLKGEEIPLLSRIISVVDSHDVMVHNRPYHKAISENEAFNELLRCSGTQFDPKIVIEMISMLKEEKSL